MQVLAAGVNNTEIDTRLGWSRTRPVWSGWYRRRRRSRLTYRGDIEYLGFAMYLASSETYENSVLHTGRPTGPPEQALDCACGLYLGDPTAWT